MEKTTSERALLDLGFEQGIEATEDPSELEMTSRVPQYRLGFVLGRSYVTCVQRASRTAAAATAGKLGARFGVKLDDLIEALGLPDELRCLIQDAYGENRTQK
ncbi:DUF2623 family protein [Paraburkholderia sp. MM6662-R1]|uniref:DUF2623 family protein n=1 Tax=Paraburkholderia sp. MM6662-R1 TaxID=2991066 RepID=UPI003D236828